MRTTQIITDLRLAKPENANRIRSKRPEPVLQAQYLVLHEDGSSTTSDWTTVPEVSVPQAQLRGG